MNPYRNRKRKRLPTELKGATKIPKAQVNEKSINV
jgi:hypothetical protein